jgi:hypothetical protein
MALSPEKKVTRGGRVKSYPTNRTRSDAFSSLLSNSFLLSSCQHFYPVHPLVSKIFPEKDSSDRRRALTLDHAFGNVVAMVKYASDRRRRKRIELLQKNGTEDARGDDGKDEDLREISFDETFSVPTSSEVDREDNREREEEERNEGDWVERLFYDCRSSRMVDEFDAIITYLSDEYFVPVDPRRKFSNKNRKIPLSHVHSSASPSSPLQKTDPLGPTEAFPDDFEFETESRKEKEEEDDGLSREKARVQTEFERIIYEEDEGRKKQRAGSKDGARTEAILQTAKLIKEEIRVAEENKKARYERRVEALKRNFLYCISDLCDDENDENDDENNDEDDEEEIAGRGDGDGVVRDVSDEVRNVERALRVLECRAGVLLELQTLKYVSSCENVYVRMRFFVLVALANEPNVAHYAGKLSDPKKFENFPLYLKLLVEEFENLPFNTHNASDLTRTFVSDASSYYQNGVVKPGLLVKFYDHPEYRSKDGRRRRRK